jgi:hypothetical protein
VPSPTHNRLPVKPAALLVLEGDTEKVFYARLRAEFLGGIRLDLRNIKGRGNINKDLLAEIYKYTYNNPNDLVRAYCCIDTESQNQSATPFDLEVVREKVKASKDMRQVLSVDAILANPEIESWFFYDIEGIYKFLNAKKSQRNIAKYQNPRNFCKKDLQRLFARFQKVYTPGERAEHFIRSLDIAAIVDRCKELSRGIALIISQAEDSTNHLLR